jgi:hypothetical protein
MIFRVVVLRYALASALALGVDMGLFLLLIEAGLSPSLAAGAGYATGMLAHWWLSSRCSGTKASGVFDKTIRSTRMGLSRGSAAL